MQVGNYNEPYMFIKTLLTYIPANPLLLIKFVSIIFDYVCAMTVESITQNIFKNNKHKDLYGIIAYSITLFLPSVLLNSACWGNADSIYAAFALISIKYLLDKKYCKAFIFLGISFALKLQALFLLPLYIFIYISERKFPIYYFLILPLVNIIMCIPSMVMRKSFLQCMQVYIGQASEYGNYLSMNFANIYNLIFETNDINFAVAPNGYIDTVGIIVTLFIFALMAFMIFYKKVKFNKQMIIEFGLWSVMIATFFLPHMHDRYLFIGEILCLFYYVYNRDKIYVPVGITFMTIYHYGKYLFGQFQIPIQYVSILFLVLVVIVTRDIVKKYIIPNF